MASVTGTISCNIQGVYTPATGPLAGQTLNLSEVLSCILRTSGVAADQVDGIYFGQLTLAASTPQTPDVRALTDVLGNSLVPARARVVAMKWYSQADNVPALVGGAGANEWDGFLSSGGTISVFPSSASNPGFLVMTAPQTTGIPITSTSHLLKVNPQTASGQFDLILFTCST